MILMAGMRNGENWQASRSDNSSGAALVRRIRTELAAESLEPTALEEELLSAAAALQDRVLQVEECIANDGLTSRTKSGMVHLHPAAAESRQTRNLLRQMLSRISMEDEPTKDPVKVRAAQARWREHSESKRQRGA